MISQFNSNSPISLYGVMILVGIIISTAFCYVEWRRKGESPFKFWLLYGWVLVLGLFGARWWYLAFNPSDFDGIISLFLLSGGRSVIGSIVFITIGVFLFTKFWMPGLEWRRIMSIVLPQMLLAQAIARWGNFFNQEVYGLPVDNLNWLPTWISNQMLIDGEYRQPLFLYESVIMFTGWAGIYIMKMDKKNKPGVHGSMTLLLYGLTRTVMELMRDNKFIMKWGNFPTSFMLAIMLAIVGGLMVIYYQWIYEKKTAVYFEFYSSARNSLIFANIKSFVKKILFIDKNSLSTLIENNKTIYNKNISHIRKIDVDRFKEKIREPY